MLARITQFLGTSSSDAPRDVLLGQALGQAQGYGPGHTGEVAHPLESFMSSKLKLASDQRRRRTLFLAHGLQATCQAVTNTNIGLGFDPIGSILSRRSNKRAAQYRESGMRRDAPPKAPTGGLGIARVRFRLRTLRPAREAWPDGISPIGYHNFRKPLLLFEVGAPLDSKPAVTGPVNRTGWV